MRFAISVLLGICMLSSVAAASPNDALHLDWLDRKIDPAKDFFAYANGGWKIKNSIPKAYSRWDNFHILEEQNMQLIKNLLETAAYHKTSSEIQQKIGDFYFSGMNETLVNSLGITPLAPEFEQINNIKNSQEFQQVLTHLQLQGVSALFDFGEMQDFKQSTHVIGVAGQGSLGLPDRDYYLKNEIKFKQIRQAYLQHITNMFELLGDDAARAKSEANTVMLLETKLAEASLSRIALRDPSAIYHPMDIAELEKVTPHFSWQHYFANIHHPEIKKINLAMPTFFSAIDILLNTVSLADWKIYLRWRVIHSFSPFLSQPYVDENFRMMAILTGVEKQLPRWKRVVNAENSALGFAIGKIYVEKHFSATEKQQVTEMINNIRAALRRDLQQVNWMTPKTRAAALHKLDLMEQRVGYPEKWRDYSSLVIDRGPYVLNIIRVNEFLNQRELNKIGKPVDKTEWEMVPQAVNAYYDPSMNRLNIPAGILQPPFFDAKAPAAVNYGAIGFVIGHEMTHGFDDAGAQFDSAGNLQNWWSEKDLKKFKITTEQIADQFSHYKINGNVTVQGKLVMGEATADLGGLVLALQAFHASNEYTRAQKINDFTPDQQFFLGAAHVWASNIRPAEASRLVITDPHPPAKYRVNGTLANMPEFKLAFGIKDKSPMVNAHCPVVW
jgi:putative endopeptidase